MRSAVALVLISMTLGLLTSLLTALRGLQDSLPQLAQTQWSEWRATIDGRTMKIACGRKERAWSSVYWLRIERDMMVNPSSGPNSNRRLELLDPWAFVVLRELINDRPGQRGRVSIHTAGWPVRWVYGIVPSSAGVWQHRTVSALGIRITSPDAVRLEGAAVNWAIHVAVLWPVVLVSEWTFRALQRGLRRRREMCAKCGYDRRGLGGGVACPECGVVPSG